MANPKKKPTNEDLFFDYLFRSKFYPTFVGHLGNNKVTKEIFDTIGDARTADEARNRIISRMGADAENGVSSDWLSPAIFAFANTNTDMNFSKDSFRPVESLMKDRRDIINSDALNSELAGDWVMRLAEGLGYNGEENVKSFLEDAFGGEASVDEIEDFHKKRLSRMLQEKLKTPRQKWDFYESMGFAPGNEDYALDNLSALAKRVQSIQQRNNANEAAKLAGEFIAPYTAKKADEGKAPNFVDLAFDLGTVPASAYGRTVKTLPKALEKLPMAGKFAGSNVDNFWGMSGLGTLFGAGFDAAHDALDSLATKHVYSEGEGNKDIAERGDVLAALSPESIGPQAAIGLGLLFAGSKRGKRLQNAEETAYKKSVKKEKDALSEEVKDWTSNPKSEVTDEAVKKNLERLDEIDNIPVRDKSNLEKAVDFLLIKGAMSDPVRNSILAKISSLWNSLYAGR